MTAVVTGQILLGLISILGFGTQIWLGWRSDLRQQRLLDGQTQTLQAQIELARLRLAERVQEVRSEAQNAYREANNVNQKIKVVGEAVLLLPRRLEDSTELEQLITDLDEAHTRTKKANGGTAGE